MSLTIPQLTLSTQPNQFSPVYGPNYWTFTASFSTSSTTAIAVTAKLFYDLQILNQNNNSLLTTLGRFETPIRQGNLFVINPESILKTQVTFPFNTIGKQYYGGVATVINESAGFGSPISAFPTISPDEDSIVEYRLRYGLEYNPSVTFSTVSPDLTYYPTDYTIYGLMGIVNHFCSVGDIITIAADSGLYQYYTGTAAVTQCVDDGTNTFIHTDQLYNASFYPAIITGEINNVQHYFTYSTPKWCYNGVRQYQEKDVDFGNLYFIRQSATPSAPSNARYFMNDYGKNISEPIPIMSGQAERGRFLVDLNIITGTPYYTNELDFRIDTFDSNGFTLSSTNNSISWAPSGPAYNQKCFTIQLFAGTETIVDGRIYKFTLASYLYSPSYTLIGYGDLASIYYIGSAPNSRYSNVRIKFLNRQGSWSYWNFNKDNKHTTEITRTEFNSPLPYDYSINPANPNYQLSKLRGQSILSSTVNETFSLNSDFISESAYSYLNQLVNSPEVYIFKDSYTNIDGATYSSVSTPIIITDTSYVHKTNNRDKIFNLTLNYKLAFDTKIQNQ